MKNGTAPNTTASTLFFLKNASHNTQPLEHYLESRGFKIKIESAVSTAVEKIKESKPDYVFVAWDHDDHKAQNISAELTDDTTMIAYITSMAEAEKRKLMELDLPFKIFAPPSGPSIQRLILKLEKEKHGLPENKKDSFQIFTSKDQRFHDLSKALIDQNRSEKLSITLFDSITDLTLEKPASQFSKKMRIKISAGQKRALEANFDEKIQGELKEIIETTKEFSTDENRQNIFCMLVQAIDCSGLILLNTTWNMSLDDAESNLSFWANELTFQYHKNDSLKKMYQSKVFLIEVPAELNVFNICSVHASVQKEFVLDEKKATIAYFDLQYNPFNLQSSDDENYLLVDHNCLKESSTIPMHLFYKLNENKKILKMFKKGTLMSSKEIDSVLGKKITPLLISINDEMLWCKYGVEVYLKKL